MEADDVGRERQDPKRIQNQGASSPLVDLQQKIKIDLSPGKSKNKLKADGFGEESTLSKKRAVSSNTFPEINNFANSVSHDGSSANPKKLQFSQLSGYQKSSIHDINPASQHQTQKKAEMKAAEKSLRHQSKTASYVEENNKAAPENDESQITKVITQANQQIINQDNIKQITINNNINITQIHNNGGPRHPFVPSNNGLLHSALSQANKSAAAAYNTKPKKSNLGLLLQNPLSQIEAPAQENEAADGPPKME